MTNSISKILAVSVPLFAALMSATAYAEADVYGKLMLGLENIDDQSEPGDYWQVESYASRFGVKGGAPTDVAGLEVIYKLEWEVDVADEKDTEDNHIKARNQFVGLSGGFGQLIIGRHDTPFKKAQGDVDLFNDVADIKRVMAGGENREDNIYQYTSPELAGGVSVSLMGITGEDPAAGEDSVADGRSLAVNYQHAGVYVATALDAEVEGPDTGATRLVGSWNNDRFGIGGLYQASDYNTGRDEKVVFASGYYSVDKTTFKLQAGSTSDYGGIADRDADLAVAGVDYKLSDKTTVGGYVSNEEGGDVGAGLNRDAVGFILIHKF